MLRNAQAEVFPDRLSLRVYVCLSACVFVTGIVPSALSFRFCGCNSFPFVLLSKIFNMYSLIFFM